MATSSLLWSRLSTILSLQVSLMRCASFRRHLDTSFRVKNNNTWSWKMHLFKMNVIQFKDFSCQIDCHDWRHALEGYAVARICRNQIDKELHNQKACIYLGPLINRLVGNDGISDLCVPRFALAAEAADRRSIESQLNAFKLPKRQGILLT